MKKSEVLRQIAASKIVGIIRENNPDVAFKAAMACVEGGIRCLEIALTTPCGLDVIESLAKVNGITVGAGTVLDPETAKAAIEVGASFLLSPAVNPAMIRMCSKYGAVSVPGAFSPTEVVDALESGADIVKIFPASTLGPGHIASIAAPLPQALFLPSGGVTVDNFDSWFVKGVFAVGVGGTLTSTAAAGDFAGVTAKARKFAEAARALEALQSQNPRVQT